MRRTHLLPTVAALATAAALLLAGLAPARADEVARTGTPTETIATRQTVFTIPFVTATAGQGDPNQLVVHLYVSRDEGQSWEHYQTAEPAQHRFSFRAASDGIYWFTTRTVPRGTAPAPLETATPELRVAVDTTQPVLSLSAEIGSAQEVRLSWQVEDNGLDAESFALTYRGGDDEWRPIAIDRARQQQGPGGLAGSAAFWPQQSGDTIEIRAEARDRAGNVTIANRRLRLPRALVTRPVTPTPEASNNPPYVADSEGGVRWPAQGDTSQADTTPGGSTQGGFTAGHPPVQPITPAYAEDTAGRTVSQSQSDDGLGWRAPDRGQPAPSQQPVQPQPAPPQQPVQQYQPPAQQPIQQPYQPPAGPTQLVPSGEGVSPRDRTAQAVPYHDPFQGVVSPMQGPVGDRIDLSPATPTPVAPAGSLVTRARNLNLDYDVEGIDPQRLARVELWGSSDGGRTWLKWGEDVDRTSPMPLAVQREGVFGFRIVIVAASGLAALTPQPGDAPEITLTVDWAAPRAQLTSAQYGTGESAGQLVITWQAADENLAERPIRLLASAQPGGPWQPIAEDLPHTGSYVWQPSGEAARDLYLRLEVSDRAGNTGVHELSQPISLEGLLPRATIRAVQPLVGE